MLRVTYYGIILNSIGKTKYILFSSILSLLLNIFLSILFYYLFGFIGPSIATLISVLFIALFQLISTSAEIKINLIDIFPWKNISLLTMLNFSLAFFVFSLKELLNFEIYYGQFFESVFLGFLWVIIYFAFIFKPTIKLWKRITYENIG